MNKSLLIVIGILLALVILVLATLFVYRDKFDTTSDNSKDQLEVGQFQEQINVLDDSVAKVSAGDFLSASEEARNLKSNSGGTIEIAGRDISEVSTILQVGENSLKDSVQLVLDHYNESKSFPFENAMQINKLISYLESEDISIVEDQLRSVPEFQDLIISSDKIATLNNLNNKSLELAKTSIGLVQSLRFKDVSIEEFLSTIKEADSALVAEDRVMKGRAFGFAHSAWYQLERLRSYTRSNVAGLDVAEAFLYNQEQFIDNLLPSTQFQAEYNLLNVVYMHSIYEYLRYLAITTDYSGNTVNSLTSTLVDLYLLDTESHKSLFLQQIIDSGIDETDEKVLSTLSNSSTIISAHYKVLTNSN